MHYKVPHFHVVCVWFMYLVFFFGGGRVGIECMVEGGWVGGYGNMAVVAAWYTHAPMY